MFGGVTDTVPLSHYIKALTAGKSLAGEEECKNKVLKTGAATYDYFDPTQVKNLPVDYTPLTEHQIHDGDVIISRMNTAELVGAAAYIWKAPDNTFLPDRLWRAELKDSVNPIFVWQIIIQSSTKEAIRRIAGGTSGSMKNISKPGLLGLSVIKVPLETQNQFAAFVEQINKSKFYIQYIRKLLRRVNIYEQF
ncbi:MAG: restriction endonuclease subunit S [Firmicutes bacterium]|nr:restriction endonuclease subunit S [Bacillota bacterium]